jgi:hypothetical protein
MLQPHTDREAPIQVDLREIRLSKSQDPQQSYEALSYVWGAQFGDQEISCHGQTLLVTQNCLLALRYLRRKSEIRSLWIDAICIDQESDAEKIHQIPLMGDVYRRASRVIVWLGCGEGSASQFIKRLSRRASLIQIPARVYRLRKSGIHQRGQDDERALEVGVSECSSIHSSNCE